MHDDKDDPVRIFMVSIDIANAGMQTTTAVADALRELAAKLDASGGWPNGEIEIEKILDLNGNTVGHWVIGEER